MYIRMKGIQMLSSYLSLVWFLSINIVVIKTKLKVTGCRNHLLDVNYAY